jgi:hypothetical protein
MRSLFGEKVSHSSPREQILGLSIFRYVGSLIQPPGGHTEDECLCYAGGQKYRLSIINSRIKTCWSGGMTDS